VTRRRRPLAAAARWAGALIAGVALAFLAREIRASWAALAAWSIGGVFVVVVGSTSLLYAAACGALSMAWYRWLRLFGEAGSAASWYRIYARTQIAKYLPGNFLHFAGRHLAGRRSGVAHSRLAAAAIHEALGLLFGASMIALLGSRLAGTRLPRFSVASLALLAGVAVLAPALLHWGWRRLPTPWRHESRPMGSAKLARGILVPYVLYLLFFVSAGGIFLSLAMATGPLPHRSLGAVVTAFSLAWIAGFLAPGAPAGLGVREAVLVLTLSDLMLEPRPLVVAAALRVVTLTGELLFFASRRHPRALLIGRAGHARYLLDYSQEVLAKLLSRYLEQVVGPRGPG
jgi:hypothetical protein